jgi:hypothetical protein
MSLLILDPRFPNPTQHDQALIVCRIKKTLSLRLWAGKGHNTKKTPYREATPFRA